MALYRCFKVYRDFISGEGRSFYESVKAKSISVTEKKGELIDGVKSKLEEIVKDTKALEFVMRVMKKNVTL